VLILVLHAEGGVGADNIQVANDVIQILSNLVQSGVDADGAVDHIQCNSGHVIIVLVLTGAVNLIQSGLHASPVISTDMQRRIVCVSALGQADSNILQGINQNRVELNPTVNVNAVGIQLDDGIAQPVVGGNRQRTSILNSSLQRGIQSAVRLESDLGLALIHVIPQGGAVVGIRSGIGSGFGINSVVGAASQHGDSHDTGQHQGSNFLELHSEFFLLMVYKR